MTSFSFDYTAVLNILALGVVVLLVVINRRHPMMMHGHGGHQVADHHAAMEHGTQQVPAQS